MQFDFNKKRIFLVPGPDGAARAERNQLFASLLAEKSGQLSLKSTDEIMTLLGAIAEHDPERERPDMILVDICGQKTAEDLPDLLTGLIAAAKAAPGLSPIPVLTCVFAGEALPADAVDRCYDLGANAHLTFPVEEESFRAHVRIFAEFWLQLARLPGRSLN